MGIKGEIKDNSKITAAFQMNPNKEKLNTIEHTISVFDEKEFYWAEKGPMGICDNHHFQVKAIVEGTLFIQKDEIMKGATWLLGGYLSKSYLNGYAEFNKSLKQEVERRYTNK